MNIIILGAGKVGGTLAENLAREDKNIVVVDTDPQKLRVLQEQFDVKTIQGYASHPDILELADAEKADLLIAVTHSDETNMIACQVAHSLFGVPKKIARIRSNNFTSRRDLFNNDVIPIDVLISPEQEVTEHICRLVKHPGAFQVLDFANGCVALVGVRVNEGSTLADQKICALREHMPNLEMRVAAIFRRNRSIVPEGETVIQVGDEVFFIAAREHIQTILSNLREGEKQYKKIMIAGGGNVGFRLAQALGNKYLIKLIDNNVERTQVLSRELDDVIVLQGNSSNKTLLLEENIENIDLFIAVTNDDETNIMSALMAKRLGAHKVMAIIAQSAYVDLINADEIDIAVSPQQATVSSLLTHIRRGDVVNVYSLRRGAAEAIEAIAHGSEETSRVVGKRIDELRLPQGTTIGAIVRDAEVLIAHDDTVILAEDHVILFLTDKTRITDVEALFQVKLKLN